MTLLQKRAAARRERRLHLFDVTRRQLRASLDELIPGEKVVLFGSITQRGRFNDASDIDLALEGEPAAMSRFLLQDLLEERMRRPIDVVLLAENRFREKILREGEAWTR